MAPAEIHELGHQIPAPFYWQQQQLQHPDHHVDALQPQNTPRFIVLSRRLVQHMSRKDTDAQSALMPNIRQNVVASVSFTISTLGSCVVWKKGSDEWIRKKNGQEDVVTIISS